MSSTADRAHALMKRLYLEFAEFRSDVVSINARLDAIEQNAAVMTGKVACIRGEIARIRGEIARIRGDVGLIKRRLDLAEV